MEIVWSDPATRDLARLLDWYAEFNPSLALRISAKLEHQVDLLALFPRMGRRAEDIDVRLLQVQGTPFTLAYSVESSVTIQHVFHKAQDWPGRF